MLSWLVVSSCVTSAMLLIAALRLRADPSVRRWVDRVAIASPTACPTESMFGRIGRRVARLGEGLRVAERVRRDPSVVRRLQLAGRSSGAAEHGGWKVAWASVGALVPATIAWSVPGAVLLAPVTALVGFKLPDVVLARRARRRQARLGSQVPELVELLVAATEAGLPPPAAFARAADALADPLGAELRTGVQQIELGVPWRIALERSVERTDVPGLRRLARTLGRSQRLGTSVRTSLRAVADEFRAERRANAEELARRAPVKMLFPLVFLILPAFLLLTVGPVLLSTIRSLR